MSAEQAGYKATFSAVEVVALMIGRSPEKVGLHHAAVHRMRDDYERGLYNPDDSTCLRSIDSARFHALGPEIFARWRDPYLGPDTRPRFSDDPSEKPQEVQLVGPMAVLERQLFRREEVARWISVNGLPSSYDFGVQSPALNPSESVDGPARPTSAIDSKEGSRDAPVVVSAPTVRRHSTKARRRDALAPIIDRLLAEAADPTDHAAVWVALLALASQKDPPPPLLGVDGEVKYRADNGEPAYIDRKNFVKRLARRAVSTR